MAARKKSGKRIGSKVFISIYLERDQAEKLREESKRLKRTQQDLLRDGVELALVVAEENLPFFHDPAEKLEYMRWAKRNAKAAEKRKAKERSVFIRSKRALEKRTAIKREAASRRLFTMATSADRKTAMFLSRPKFKRIKNIRSNDE